MTLFSQRHCRPASSLLLAVSLTASLPLLAAPGTLATAPLYLSTAVEPNIVFLTDDSGSMDWSLLTDALDGSYTIASPAWELPYYYAHPTQENLEEQTFLKGVGPKAHIYTVPTQAVMNSYSSFLTTNGYTGWQGVWRSRNADFNHMYYDPTVTYSPWQGTDADGVAFADSTPTAARLDPYLGAAASGNTIDLTTSLSFYSYIPDEAKTGFVYQFSDTMFPASYYTWTDSNSNGVVDASDTHAKVEIKSTTPTYTGSSERYDCAAAPVCTYAEEIQNFANWFTYYRRRSLTAKNALGRVIANLTGARVGLATLNNNNSVNTKVRSLNTDPASGNKKALLDKVFQSGAAGSTPLRTTLRDVGRYYECKSGNLYGASGSDCPMLSAANGGMCQQNFSIVMSDGYYDGTSPDLSGSDGAASDNTDGDGNTSYDGGDYADSYDNTLADVAMHYYERDLSSTLNDQVPTLAGTDPAPHQHMVTYTAAFGVSGSLDPEDTKTPGNMSDTDPTDPGFAWPDPQPNTATSNYAEKVDDLWHAAFNGRGKFLSAKDPTALDTAISSVMSDIIGRTSSAAAVAFNSTSLGTGSVVYLARFNSVSWDGELLAFNLDPFSGAVASTPSWNAGDQLDLMSPSSRVIYSYNDTTHAGLSFDTLATLSTSQQADLNTSPLGTADGLGQARIDYLRGDRTHEGSGYNFRIRTSVLGDIVHSNPVYVGEPLMNYPDTDPFGTTTDRYSGFKSSVGSRTGVIYVGGNDGMLHGFDENTGDEVMAYVPNILFSSTTTEGLHYLTDPAYNHRYYVDLSPTVADVYTQTTPTGSAGWKTVLIGGLRGGGSGLFALDVTDPSYTNTSTNADNVVMWEFTNNDDPDLGYTFSKPSIALMPNGRWAAVVGNGYNNNGDGQAKLFILFLDGGIDGTWTAGTDYIEITTGVGSPTSKNGLSTPALVDTDGDHYADRAYAGDLEGNLWVFDLSGANASTWGAAYKSGSTPKPLFTATDSLGNPQPITTKPVLTQHPTVSETTGNTPDLMVYFGTGQFIVNGDKTTTGTQTMYGVWDSSPTASKLPLTRTDLLQQSLESWSTSTVRSTTNLTVDYSTQQGWFFDLPDTGERIVANPKIRGDYVFFNSMIPETTPCSYGGYGWLMALTQLDGARPTASVFDINNDGMVNTNDLITGETAGGMRFDEGLPAESNFLSDNQYTPGSTGNLQQDTINAGTQIDAGRMSWREILFK